MGRVCIFGGGLIGGLAFWGVGLCSGGWVDIFGTKLCLEKRVGREVWCFRTFQEEGNV